MTTEETATEGSLYLYYCFEWLEPKQGEEISEMSALPVGYEFHKVEKGQEERYEWDVGNMDPTINTVNLETLSKEEILKYLRILPSSPVTKEYLDKHGHKMLVVTGLEPS